MWNFINNTVKEIMSLNHTYDEQLHKNCILSATLFWSQTGRVHINLKRYEMSLSLLHDLHPNITSNPSFICSLLPDRSCNEVSTDFS